MSKDDETINNPNDPVRRVYALPQELADRIVEYQKEKGLPSEVEAARRLLDEALKSRDDMTKIINRFLSKLSTTRIASEVAKDVIVGHPLVESLSFDQNGIQFLLKENMPAPKNVYIGDNGTVLFYDDGYVWEKNQKTAHSAGNIKMVYSKPHDPDIPF